MLLYFKLKDFFYKIIHWIFSNLMGSLLKEIIVEILLFLDYKNITKASLINKEWNLASEFDFVI